MNMNWINELFLLSDIIVFRHLSVSLNNEKICREISEDKIAVCESELQVYGEETFRIWTQRVRKC
jgi:hypothetical protein